MNKHTLTDEIDDFDVEDEIDNDRFDEVEEIYYSSDDEDEPHMEDQHENVLLTESNNFKNMRERPDSEMEYGLHYSSEDVEEGQEDEQCIDEENVFLTESNNLKKVRGTADSEMEYEMNYSSEDVEEGQEDKQFEPEMEAEDKSEYIKEEIGSKSGTDFYSDDEVQIVHESLKSREGNIQLSKEKRLSYDVEDEICDNLEILFNPTEDEAKKLSDTADRQVKRIMKKMEKVSVAPGEAGSFKNWGGYFS